MKNFIIHITDPAGGNQQVEVSVPRRGDLGRAAQLAIDDMLSKRGGDFAFPIFIDIHPAGDFALVAALYAASRQRGVGRN